ncbi:MAG: hypothetical protein P1U38_00665 [Aeromicrobium sp.]|uniref:hypothetical protein n=1 Tax=Aeromicrobium sp. TaxID=1871063 RepID=UPI0026077869|nr:hypothetical protein [Aeromicrobium sp.]MDF1703265.1 hypothetical protein [Aeromicrobium sp.]
MTRRRTLLLGGVAVAGAAAVGGVAAAGRLDDVARELGIDPVPRPAEGDTALLAEAAEDQARLIAVVGALSPTLTALLTEQLEALGGAETVRIDAATDLAAARAAFAEAATSRARQATDAVSPDLARTLGSVSACLTLMGTGAVT